jgi:hypothetical protein
MCLIVRVRTNNSCIKQNKKQKQKQKNHNPYWVLSIKSGATGAIESESRGALLERLLGKVEHAIEFAGALVVRYKVAQRLSMPFDEVGNRDPYQLLLFLLMHGKDLFPLTDAFIQYNHLNYSKVRCSCILTTTLSHGRLFSAGGNSYRRVFLQSPPFPTRAAFWCVCNRSMLGR